MKNFNEIYKDNFRSVQFCISKMVNDSEITQELTQVVFVKAFEKMDSFDSNKSNISTWLINIAKNTVLDHKRLACNRLNISISKPIGNDNDGDDNDFEVGSNFESSKVSNPEILISEKETVKHVVDYLRTLPILKRRIGLYRFLYDRALHEISDELNIPLGTVKRYSIEIKESLRHKLV